MSRDMTQRQFDATCERLGFKPRGMLGYYLLPSGIQVSILNAGSRRRDQLAYLIGQNAAWQRKREALAAPSPERNVTP